ncbi:MAG TPA: serine/threonine-protein kinase [Planctomycetota bacterium]|jgi:serine/threonine-protein kinase|nr:serine/threonine-protein kinase [Planctomycetota bacterium]
MASDLPKIPGYMLKRKIASGGCAEVFEARDIETEQRVAIKLLATRHLQDKVERNRLVEEGELGLRLHAHEQVVKTLACGDLDGRPYTVLEFCEGVPLSEMIAKKTPINDINVILMTKQICLGLAYIHGRGILHRDLKPDNLMVRSFEAVKIIDFGFAEKQGFSLKKFFKSRLEGSPAYMAPELLTSKKASPATDIFGMGVALYEASTGTLPFPGQTDQAIIDNILNRNVKPLTIKAQNSKVLPLTMQMIMQCIEKDPAKRYQTAQQVLLAINRNPAIERMNKRG